MEIVLSFIFNHWSTIINIASLVVSACAAIAALTPTPVDDKVLSGLRKAIDILGLNVGHAKNSK